MANHRWSGYTFLLNAGENAVGAGAAMALPVVVGTEVHVISDVPWYLVLGAFTLGAFASVLKSLASLYVGPGKDNGTASLLPGVVDRNRLTPNDAS